MKNETMNQRLPSYAELLERTDAPPGSAWGLFGADDEVGTLNHLTPERVRAASRLVRTGEVYNLDLPLTAFQPSLMPSRQPLQHRIFSKNPFHRDDWVDSLYTQSASQLDGLRHMGHPDFGFYNGADATRFEPGDPLLGINRYVEHGMVGRGVLLDVGRYLAERGTPIDQASNQGIGADVLDATAAAQGVEVRTGDIVMLRFGWLSFYLRELDDAGRARLHADGLRCPGLDQSHDVAAWLWDRGCAVVASDNIALESWPASPDSPFTTAAERNGELPLSNQSGIMHRVLIPLLGLAIGELWDLDDLARACAADGVWECMVTVKPLNLIGGVGSPSNALAIR